MMERNFWLRILIQIWPTIRRAINDVLSFVQRIIKAFIHIVLDEIR
jgi:cell shape-determining protein MreC